MPRDRNGQLTVSTIGDLIDIDSALYVVCDTHGCNKIKPVDLEKLADRYGRQLGCLHNDLVRLPWRCQECHGRKVTFRIVSGAAYRISQDPDEPFQS